ncbi:MAG: PH domain-containing protein [Rhodobacteraceae bacterium]|nr:PH domain-containing protein [Paracoccaceae bacterium]
MAEDLDDFHVEPVRGLPERPPEGEKILWQGAPNSWALAREALSLYWVAGYFVLLAAWRGGVTWDRSESVAMGLKATVPYLVMGIVACAVLALIALVLAKTTVYTITNRRVAMRIGAALTVTLNVPYTMLGSADLRMRRDGTGTIALDLMGTTRLSYLVCWPHVRPWHMSPTQPALRAIPDAKAVSAILAEAARTRIEERAQTVEIRAVQMPAE